MKTIFMSWLVKALVKRLINHTSFEALLEIIDLTERDYSTGLQKHAEALSVLRTREGDEVSSLVLNLVIELGVYAYKRLL